MDNKMTRQQELKAYVAARRAKAAKMERLPYDTVVSPAQLRNDAKEALKQAKELVTCQRCEKQLPENDALTCAGCGTNICRPCYEADNYVHVYCEERN